MLGQKRSLNKFKKIKIIANIFSDHNGMKLEINLNKKIEKHSNTWRINSMLLSNEWVISDIKEENKKYLETNENEQRKTYATQQKQPGEGSS